LLGGCSLPGLLTRTCLGCYLLGFLVHARLEFAAVWPEVVFLLRLWALIGEGCWFWHFARSWLAAL